VTRSTVTDTAGTAHVGDDDESEETDSP
jgi:hypothetical protein